MKPFFRNLLIFFFYLTTIPFWRRLFLAKPLLRVWCLHEVKDHQVDQFEKKLHYLKKHYNIVSPQQFIDKELSPPKPDILITFDDGYDSWFKNVLPILKKHRVKAVFFLKKDFEKQAAPILSAGHCLGGHSVSHPYLTELSSEDLQEEVINSVKSRFFAYPYGDKKSFNNKVTEQIKKAGYQYGFTILPGFNTAGTNPYLLHRDALDPDVADSIFKLWLKGCYDWKN